MSGQRCSNAGNAYQCTTTGTSTSAPTGTGSSIASGGAVFKWLSTVDYTNLQAWYNALPGTLTQPVVALIWNDAPITTTPGIPFLTMGRVSTSASNNITIRPAPGESFIDTLSRPTHGSPPALAFNSANGVSFLQPSSSGANTNYFGLSDNNVVVYGLQFRDPNATSGASILQPTQTCTVSNCIIDGYTQDSGAYIINPALSGASNSVFTFVNNLVIDRADAGISFGATVSGNYNATYANNTFIALNTPTNLSCIVDTSNASGVTVNQTNNIMLGYPSAGGVTESQNAGTTINVNHGLFSSGTLTNSQVVLGSGNLFSQATSGQFINATNNFRIVGGSTAINAGATDTTDIPTAVDIIGRDRQSGSWTIGAYQAVVPSSVGTGDGQGAGAGVSSAGRAVGSGSGHGGGAGVPYAGGTFGTGAGHGGGLGITTGNQSVGTGGGQGGGQAYDTFGALSAAISLHNPGPQVVNVPFQASGQITLTPGLQFTDDSGDVFTPIPQTGVSPIGTSTFEFTHPGVATAGEQNLLVEDLSTDASAAVNYPVLSTAVAAAGIYADKAPTSLSTIIPAYLYEQYYDDEDLQAFISAYNAIAQSYLDWFNAINLPVYTGLSGALLDWVAAGLYGIERPVLAVVKQGPLKGPFNTYELDTLPFNGSSGNATSEIFPVTDDIFQRIITWSFYKGDGRAFTIPWLKRRVARFLAGANGTDYIGPTTQISVTLQGSNVFTITITSGDIPLTSAPIFQAAVLSGVLPLPFQYTFNVLIKTTD